MARFDETPLPPNRPPTIDFPAFDPRRKRARRSALPWLLAIGCGVTTWAAMRHLGEVEGRHRRALAAARDEAAEHRAARFVAEAEAQRLTLENQKLRAEAAQPAHASAGPDAATVPAATTRPTP